MKYSWYQKGEVLLQEIKETNLVPGMLAVWYVGQMGVVAKGCDVTVCLDPVLNDLCYPDGTTIQSCLFQYVILSIIFIIS